MMKPNKEYIKPGEVRKMGQRHGLSAWTVRQLLGPGSRARKYLPNKSRPVYVRRVVLELLGLPEDAS